MLGALFGFNGRLSRPGFWEVLFSIVLIDVLLVLGRMYVADSGLPGGFGPASALSQALLAAIPWALGAFTIWSLLAAMVKRCHDRGRTGALILVGLIPVIGWLWLLIDLFVLEGEERRNRYGRPPHAPVVEEAPRSRIDWGAEPVPAPEPAFAAAPAEPPAPEPAQLEPVAQEPMQAPSDAVDVYLPEHPAPEPERVVATAPLADEAFAEAAQPADAPAAAPEAVHAEAEALQESPAEAEVEPEPELPLELSPASAPAATQAPDAIHGEMRPLMLDRI